MRAQAWMMMVLWGCGSGVVDVGTLPEDSEVEEDGEGEGSEGAKNPDGSPCSIPELDRYQLVFDSDGGKLERRIYSMRADGTAIEPLTGTHELAREPAMSPDGSQLAYATPEGMMLLDMATGQSELLLAGADQPDWAPDGSLLAYRQSPFVTSMQMPDRLEGVFFACTECNYPDFGPNSDWIAASTIEAANYTYEYSITTASRTGAGGFAVPRSETITAHPTISPDGVWVAAAFECPGSDRSALWTSPLLVPTRACEGRRITRPDSPSATNPEWGPDVLIAYERGAPPRDIGIVAADTGQECFIRGPGDDRNPSWVVSSFGDPK